MSEHTPRRRRRKRAQRGSKCGWFTHSAKFSPDESEALEQLAEDTDDTIDGVVHTATVLYLRQLGRLPRAA